MINQCDCCKLKKRFDSYIEIMKYNFTTAQISICPGCRKKITVERMYGIAIEKTVEGL